VRAAAVIATATLAAASCSSSLQPPDAGGLDTGGAEAAGVDTTIPAGGFISADVDGVTIRAELHAGAFFWSGIADGWLDAEARNDEWAWVLLTQNAASPAAVTNGYVVLYPRATPTMSFASYATGGASAVTVTAAAPDPGDMLEGTFTATLNRLGNTTLTKTVTNGAFRLPRVDEPPPPL
jgi:hypothetical protein